MSSCNSHLRIVLDRLPHGAVRDVVILQMRPVKEKRKINARTQNNERQSATGK